MAEVNTPRLMAAAKEFNIGKDTLVDFLVSKGFGGDDLKPTSKISEEMYRVLQVEFQPDKVAKQKAEQIDLPKNAVTDLKKEEMNKIFLLIKKNRKSQGSNACLGGNERQRKLKRLKFEVKKQKPLKLKKP